MAHKKSGGIAQNIKDSPGQRLGVKKFEGEKVISGNIIIRQRGTKYFPGKGVRIGKDHTIFAVIDGVVHFTEKKQTKFNGRVYKNTFVNVKPAGAPIKSDEKKITKSKDSVEKKEKVEKVEKAAAKTTVKKTTKKE